MGPQNYRIDVASPLQKAMAMEDRRNQQENRERQFGMQTRQLDLSEQRMNQNQGNIDREFGYRQSMDERKAAYLDSQKQAAAEKMKAISDFAGRPNKTAEDYTNMINEHPELAQELKIGYDILDEANQKNSVTEATQLFSAIESGSPEVAENILRRRMEAATNSGDEKGAAGAKATLEMLKVNPEAAKTTLGLFLASAEPKAFEALQDAEQTAYDRKRDVVKDKQLAAKDRRAEDRADKVEDRAVKRHEIAVKREMARETAAAKKAGKPRNTTTDEMNSLFKYGDEQGMEMKDVAKVLNSTRGQSVEERLAAIDAAAGGETKAEKVAAKKGAPKYKKGQRAKNKAGDVMVFNGKSWVKE